MTDQSSTLLRAVQDLDPERHAPPVDSEALLLRVREAVRTAPEQIPDVVPRPVPRTARRVLAGAAAALLVGAVVVTVAQPGGSPAYAGWSPTPTVITSPSAVEQAGLCLDSVPVQAEGGGADDITHVPVAPVLAEQRGTYTFVLSVGEDTVNQCLVVQSRDGAEPWNQSLTAPGLTAADGLDASAVRIVDQGADWAWEAPEGPITTVVGQAGDGVRAVEVATADGTSAAATVDGGWWVVWFPGSVDLTDTIEVTDDAGTTAQVDVATVETVPSGP